MFARIKKINGNEYLYEVENKWKKGKVRQKVKKYLGRVYQVKKENNISFIDHHNIDLNIIKNTDFKQITKLLIELELFRHDFEKKGKDMIKDNLKVNLNTGLTKCKQRQCAIKLNEGYMCKNTLKELFEFSESGDYEEIGLKLALKLVNAGINIDKEIFIAIVQNNK